MAVQDESLTLVEHLAELRDRIMVILVFLVVGVIFGFVFAKQIVAFLVRDLVELNAFRPMDVILVYLRIAVYVGIVVALPMTLYQIWAFVKPALTEDERKNTVWFIPGAIALFLVGASFAFFGIFPFMWKFLMSITESMDGVNSMIGVQEYVSFVVNIVAAFGILFEMPIVIIFLTKLRIVNPERLRSIRKIAYLVLIIVSTMITPPDFFSALMVYFPLIGLYEISILLSGVVYKKQLAKEAAYAAEFGGLDDEDDDEDDDEEDTDEASEDKAAKKAKEKVKEELPFKEKLPDSMKDE